MDGVVPSAHTAHMRVRIVLAVVMLGLTAAAASGTPAAGARPAQQQHAASSGSDWPTYHATASRSGYLSRAKKWDGGLHVVTRIRLDGAVYASPLVVLWMTMAATENDTVYAFGPANRLLWRRHLGTPVRRANLPCGNIDPLGITGTPTFSSR